MTREEAKEILTHNWTRVDNPNYSESELDEAFFMAIEALKGGDAEVNETKSPYMQQSRHDDGRMTREEAIADIKNNIKPVVGGKSLDMAIEALSAEESVTLYATPKATYIRPLTEEIAIEFLQDSGWLPNHDKEIGNPPMLVRCKDCIHWKADNEVFELGFCCVFPQKWVAETFYCADGERREE